VLFWAYDKAIMIRALIFDCFGVFFPDPIFAYMHDPSTPQDKAKALHALDVQAAQGHLRKEEFVNQVSTLLNQSPEKVERRFFQGLNRDQQLVDYVQELRSKYRVALLSNIGGDMMDGFFTPAERDTLFDTVVLSGDVGITKPDPKIFEVACSRLGISLDEAVMIDDVPGYIKAAKTVGMQGICYRDFGQFKHDLELMIG
jgi:epoxide hydrolase-like predicted phosphatase